MEKPQAFKSVLDVTKAICEFIAGEHYSVFRRITGATFGVSVSVVSVRIFEKTPDLENLEERTGAGKHAGRVPLSGRFGREKGRALKGSEPVRIGRGALACTAAR